MDSRLGPKPWTPTPRSSSTFHGRFKLPSFGEPALELEPDPKPESPGTFAEVSDLSTSASIGAGITGALAGGIIADSLVTAANVGLTGELLTDAGVIGAVLLGGGAVYAASRPDEAGEAARFVGGSVANVTGAYAELAAVNAELALLEQQQKAQEALDDKLAEISALPGQLQEQSLAAADETVAAVKAAPKNLLDSVTGTIKRTLDGAQASVQGELNAAKAKIKGD